MRSSIGAEDLSQKEAEVLKYFSRIERQKNGRVIFSRSKACVDLKLSEEEFDSTIYDLFNKGFIRIDKLFTSPALTRKLLGEIEELDLYYLEGGLSKSDWTKKREEFRRGLDALSFNKEAEVPKEPISPSEVLEYRKQVDEHVERLGKLVELKSEEKVADAVFETIKKDYNEKLRNAQSKINEYKEFAWKKIESLRSKEEELQKKLEEIRVRLLLNEFDQAEHKRRSSTLVEEKEKITQRISLMLSTALGFESTLETKEDIPKELRIELEVLDAKKLLNDIDPRAYETKKREIQKKIDETRKTFRVKFEPEDIGKYKDELAKKVEKLDALKKGEALLNDVYQALIKGIKKDREGIRKYFTDN